VLGIEDVVLEDAGVLAAAAGEAEAAAATALGPI
jgi:hypothetical protein